MERWGWLPRWLAVGVGLLSRFVSVLGALLALFALAVLGCTWFWLDLGMNVTMLMAADIGAAMYLVGKDINGRVKTW